MRRGPRRCRPRAQGGVEIQRLRRAEQLDGQDVAGVPGRAAGLERGGGAHADVVLLAGAGGDRVHGGRGGVAGCANVYPRTMASIYDCFAAGDLEKAQEYQASIASFRACFKYGNPNTIVKTAVRLLGYNVGKCRAPFNQVPEEGIEALKKVLDENAARGMC